MEEWCGTDADFDNGEVETVEDCGEMVDGAVLLADLVADFPDARLRASLQGMASLVRTSAQECVDDENTFALMGMMGVSAFVAEMDVRFAELGVEMVEADGSRMGYQP